jgi:thymidylate synthase (FAD)
MVVHRILDEGEIELLDTFGDELTVVNSARVSFHKRKEVLDESDLKLLDYLIRHEHTSPFRHVFLRFRIKAPEFVLRQWYKHVVGAEWTSVHPCQLHGWNEVSGRYVKLDQYYHPNEWRAQSTSKKQGSDGLLNPEHQIKANELFDTLLAKIQETYNGLLELNVATEMARIILPLNIYSETMWTTSLQAVLHFICLRRSDTTQLEMRLYADRLYDIVKERFPHIMEKWSQ